MSQLEEKIKMMPEDLQKQVIRFIDDLMKKREHKKSKLKLTWIGGLKEYKHQFTALELQKKAGEWRD